MRSNLSSRLLAFLILGLVWQAPAAGAATPGLAWRSETGYRWAAFPAPVSSGRAGFTALSPTTTGITFTNVLTDAKAAENQIRLNGSGVALGDVDGDGWCDIYLCRLEGDNALYRNLGGWQFEEITTRAGVACPNQYSTGAALADLDGDGDLDLVVTSIGGGARLFLNDGRATFREATDRGLVNRYCGLTLALADVEGDGDLDLYVCNYRTTTVRSTGLEMLNVGGRRMLKPEDREEMEITADGFLRERGEPDFLYLNDGQGRFQPASWTGGRFLDETGRALTNAPRHWTLSAMFRDVNGDRAPDLYVCGDFWSPDTFWLNDGRGHFRAVARETIPHTCSFTMGLDFADLNRDGQDDFLVLDMLSPDHRRRMRQTALIGVEIRPLGIPVERPQIDRNTLFLSRGDQTYADIALFSGLDATEWSWCPVFLDVDLDGYEDLLIPTGHGFDTQDMDAERRIQTLGPQPRDKVALKLLHYPRLALPNFAFRNRGDLTFEDRSAAWGFDTVGISQGIAAADLDNDGDLDVVVNNMNSGAGVYRNETTAPRVAVRLKGHSPNPRGIGAKIQLLGGPVPQSQEMIAGGRFLSSDDALRVFAAGEAKGELIIEVDWRSGRRSVIRGVQSGRIYEVEEPAAPPASATPVTKPKPMFEDVSPRLDHRHVETAFDDFARQPLLSRRLSQNGPGVAWADLNGDGWDDLAIGAGRGGAMTIFINDQRGGFTRRSTVAVTRDQAGLAAALGRAREPLILAGSSNYEDGLPVGSAVRAYRPDGTALEESFPAQVSSAGPLALADVDGDGDLDLFVGGRVVPGRYPEPATSTLFLNQEGRYAIDSRNAERLKGIGLVSGAIFSDLDGDGDPDLILACEWGPVRVLRNEGALFQDVTGDLGLAVYLGWWNGVATGDLDGDGRLDILASNWGRNTHYERYRRQPLRGFYRDVDGNNSVELLEAHFDPGMQKVVPSRSMDAVLAAMPFLGDRFPTRDAFGAASVEEILGNDFRRFQELAVNTLESMLFLNRGDHFEARPLPVEAQFAPAFAVCIADMDGDGAEDLFLSQNFFATEPMAAPMDAGRGLWLKGKGDGGLDAVAGELTGVRVYGEQRGAALADYDGDGRVDLVVTQNAAATALYHNVTARPGLRVRLQAGTANPTGVGALIRLAFGERIGPAREVQAGSGYWSQNSPVQVLAAPQPPTAVWVRWPGGKVTTTPLSAGAREIALSPAGLLEVPPLGADVPHSTGGQR